MAELKYSPLNHDHAAFLAKAQAKKGFAQAYEDLGPEYEAIDQLLKARTQDVVTKLTGATDRAVPRPTPSSD